MKTIQFKNPANQHIEKIQSPALGAFLLGPLSIGLAGAWGPAVGYFVLTFFTGGLFWFVLPFLAEGILRKHYLGKGWIEVQSAPGISKSIAAESNDPIDVYFAPIMTGIVLCSLILVGAMALVSWAV